MLKKLIKGFSIIIVTVALLIVVSIIKFHTWNFTAVLTGMIKIQFSVIMAKPSVDEFIKYMKDRGYDMLEEKQLGSMYVFYDHLTDTENEVFCNMNGYYSLWTWN